MNTLKFLVLAAAILFIPVTANAQADTPFGKMPAGLYKLDKGHASLTWKVSHLGLSDYTARFTRFDAGLNLDPANPANSSVSVTVDPTSIETDYPFPEKKDFDAKLVSDESWFNAGTFPSIEFKSTAVEVTGENTGKITGDLEFLGVTKPLTLDVVFNGAFAMQPFSKKPALGFSATGTLKRSEWGMGTYVPNIGDDVELLIEVEFGQEQPESEAAAE